MKLCAICLLNLVVLNLVHVDQRVLVTIYVYIFDDYDMVEGYFFDYIESSSMLLAVLIGGTYSSMVNCTRAIAVGQH
jgi:hypothetical protein